MVFRLWELAVAPVLRAAGAQRVVEIGALQGETTVKLLDLLGPESEVHVIDPVPQFDPSEHERRFPGRYHFHRAISHDVLPELPAVDAALIDGDHNWYTVFNELKMLAATAVRRARRCRSASSTTSAGPTAAATSTTRPSGSRRSSASPGRGGGSSRAEREAATTAG